MRKKALFIAGTAVLCITLLFHVSHAAAQENTGTNDEMLNEINQFRTWLTDAWNKQDIDKILSSLHPDIIVTWQDGSVSHGRDEVRKYIDEKMKGPNSAIERVSATPVVEGRKIYGDHILSYGHMNDEFVLRKDSVPLKFDSRFSALLVRDNGHMLLEGIHFSTNAFDNAVQRLKVQKMRNWAGGIGLAIGLLISCVLKRSCCRKA